MNSILNESSPRSTDGSRTILPRRWVPAAGRIWVSLAVPGDSAIAQMDGCCVATPLPPVLTQDWYSKTFSLTPRWAPTRNQINPNPGCCHPAQAAPIHFWGDRRPPDARRPAGAARRLRVARAPRPIQGLGAGLFVELRQPAAPARRVLDPVRRRAAHPADHRVGRAALRDLPVRWPPPLDILRDIAAIRRVGDPCERSACQKGADAVAAPAGCERALSARQLPPQRRGASRDPRYLRPAAPGRPRVDTGPRCASDRDESWIRVSPQRARCVLPRRPAHSWDPPARLVLPHTSSLPGPGAERPARAAAPAVPEPDDRDHRRVSAGAAGRTRAAVGRARVLGGHRPRPFRRRLLVFRPRQG